MAGQDCQDGRPQRLSALPGESRQLGTGLNFGNRNRGAKP